MKAFRHVTARVAVLDRADVDTDQIIPKQFLKRLERTGYGEFLFYDWRQDPDFELNRPQYQGAGILLAGANFGCGSSREHAAWALEQAGFAVVIAPSFGDIFRQNALKSGLLAVVLPEAAVKALIDECRDGGELEVDLERQLIVSPQGREIPFEFDAFARESLLAGLDDIARTLKLDEQIAAYEAGHDAEAPLDTVALLRRTRPLPLV